jgi:arabinoxylan arabinofuranohydrolase
MRKWDSFSSYYRLMFAVALLCVLSIISGVAQEIPYKQSVCEGNPIVPNIGLDDGHMRVFGNRIYDYACHDYVPESKDFVLKMWWVWSSGDLQTWTCEGSLSPTILGFPEGFKDCWATDAISRNGKYYWYLCNPLNTYVVVSDSPIGPWESPLGNKPLMEGRDPAAFIDNDGKAYLVTGVWDYRIAELGEDMISLAEEPKTIKIINPRGPYNLDGNNTEQPTDDKPYLHKHNGKYYLSWGCYYAMADNVYGPYSYKGCFVTEDRTEPEFRQAEAGLTHDRHGSFFEFNNQTYFNCNDLSSNGANRFWRNTIIMYIHYRDNGEIEPAYINKIGAGRYDASAGKIEAENYFSAAAAEKSQNNENGFEMRVPGNASQLVYSNVMNLSQNSNAAFRVSSENPGGCVIEIWGGRDYNELLGTCVIPETGGIYKTVACRLNNNSEKQNIMLTFKGTGGELLRLDWMSFSK